MRAAEDLELVAEVDTGADDDRLDDLVAAGAEAVVDFTHPDVVMDNLRVLRLPRHPRRGRHHRLRRRAAGPAARPGSTASPGTGVLVAPNFSIGAILMMRFAAEAAPFFESVEIVELHHPDKADAPSGTARRTASLVAAARRRPVPARSPTPRRPRSTGPAAPTWTGIRVHGLRIRGLVAHQEVILGGDGRDAHDPARLAGPGLVHPRGAARRCGPIGGAPGLTVGLESFLGLDRG